MFCNYADFFSYLKEFVRGLLNSFPLGGGESKTLEEGKGRKKKRKNGRKKGRKRGKEKEKK